MAAAATARISAVDGSPETAYYQVSRMMGAAVTQRAVVDNIARAACCAVASLLSSRVKAGSSEYAGILIPRDISTPRDINSACVSSSEIPLRYGCVHECTLKWMA